MAIFNRRPPSRRAFLGSVLVVSAYHGGSSVFAVDQPASAGRPSVHGSKEPTIAPRLDAMGMRRKLLARVQALFDRPRGLFVCYAPPTSGRSDTERTSIFELLVVTEPMRQLIRDGATEKAIDAEARKSGKVYRAEEGLLWVIQGDTSLQELLRALT